MSVVAQFETARLIIRPIRQADHDALQALILDPQVVAYVRYRRLTGPADFDRVFTQHFLADTTTTFGLETKADHQLIGFYEFHGDAGTGELTYALSQSAWGHGFVAEAGRALMAYGFETLGFDRIEAHYASVNPNSGRVMAKMGMHDEGELMTFTLDNGETVHVMIYGLSRAQWRRAQQVAKPA